MTTEVLADKKYYTIPEYEALSDEGNCYELIEGELVYKNKGIRDMSGGSEPHSRIAVRLTILLGGYVVQNNLGEVYNSDARYIVQPPTPPSTRATVRQCDVAFMAAARVTGGVVTMPYAPDMAIEIVSERNEFLEIERKTREYRNAGTKLVWVIESEDKLIHIYRAGSNQRETLNNEQELDGENIVPGFKLKISTLFTRGE